MKKDRNQNAKPSTGLTQNNGEIKILNEEYRRQLYAPGTPAHKAKQESLKRWHAAHPEYKKNYSKKYRSRAAELKRLDRQRNPEKYHKWEKYRSSRDKEKRDAQRKARYLKNHEAILARARAKYDPKKNREIHLRYVASHRIQLAERRKQKYAANRQAFKTINRINYIKREKQNREYAIAYRMKMTPVEKIALKAKHVAWRKENGARLNEYARRRKLKLKVESNEERSRITSFYLYVMTALSINCHWCGRSLKKKERSVDHIIPIKHGGPHALSNLAPACRTCNTQKGAKLPHEFYEHQFKLGRAGGFRVIA